MNAEKMRKYWHEEAGIYVPSVTSCDIDSKGWLAPWAAKATLNCAMELHKTKPIDTWDDEDIKWIKKETKRQAERGMHIGTIFHEMALDGYLATGEWPDPKDCPSWPEVCDAAHEFKGYWSMARSFRLWCEQYLKDVVEIEFACFGDRYAGRCDILANVSNYAWLTKKAQKTTEEKIVLCYIDLKTSTQYSEFTPLQIAGYREADGRVDDNGKSADGLIIRVDKDNAVHNIDADKQKTVVYTKHIGDEALSDAYRRLMYRVDFIWKESDWENVWKNVEKGDLVVDGDD
jgi:hypothetical protein